MTILPCWDWNTEGKEPVNVVERIFPAVDDQLKLVQAFINEQLKNCACSSRVKFQLEVAVEVEEAVPCLEPEPEGVGRHPS